MVEFINAVKEQSLNLYKTGKLFRVNAEHLFQKYLEAFDKVDNPTFRDPNSSTHNCNNCHNFIRRYGNMVAIDENNQIITLFSNLNVSEKYKKVADSLDVYLKTCKIVNVFFETYNELNSLPYEKYNTKQQTYRLGIDKNHKQYSKDEVDKFGVVNTEKIYTFNHFHLDLPTNFVDKSGKSIESIMADYRDKFAVFFRAMEEISIDTFNLAIDLINQGSLLDGTSHIGVLNAILPWKKDYDKLADNKKENFCWLATYTMNESLAKFRSNLIGQFLIELTEGKELNKACEDWNKRVDPVNYHKAKSPITKKQIEEAKKFVQENGYEESFIRRLATLDDIKANEIIHITRDNNKVKPVSIFDNVKAPSTRHKRSEFDKVEEVSIDKFLKDILPTCSSIEAYLENRMDGNLCNITTSNVKESKPIFKWKNNYSYTFNGNIAGKSMIKEAVKSRGGKTEGIVNIRLAFPTTVSDYDLHVIEPTGFHIYYHNRRQVANSSGMLDLDAQGADGHFPPEKRVENVIYTNGNKMPKGKYLVYVHNYNERDKEFGFTLEIEINGEVTTFNYNKFLKEKDKVDVCYIDYNGTEFNIIPIIPVSQSNSISKELWGLETNNFHKVNLVCLSPNHWEDNEVGNKYYMFMLEGCKNPNQVRGFHNEHLIQDLLQHRKVMDVLGNSVLIEPSNDQLAGIGFNSTVKDELILKLSGSFKRVIKVKF